MSAPKITINKIAELAGVSKTTVSLVVNGKSNQARISPQTEKRVLGIVRELNYFPSKLARNFRLHKTETIGFILPDLKNPFFSRLSHAMELEARKNGYQLLIGCSNDMRQTEIELAQNLLSYAIEGLIVASAISTEDLLRKIYDTNIPAVFIDREIKTERISSVSSDNEQGAYEAVDHLCSRDVHEIVYIGGDPELSTSRERFSGFQRAIEKNRLPLRDNLIHQGSYQSASGYKMFNRFYTDQDRFPEAVFTGSYTLLEGVLQACRAICGSVPEDLNMATFDDHPLLDYLPNRVLSVRQDYDQLAQSSIRILLRAINGDRQVEHRKIKPHLIIR